MIDAYQIPEDELQQMTTNSLLETVLGNAFLTQFDYYDSSIDAMNIHKQNFNIYQEMLARRDYRDTLIEMYEDAGNKAVAVWSQDDLTAEEQFYICVSF